MKASLVCLMAAAALPLGACASTTSDHTLASAGTGAAVGAAGGAAVGALAGGDVLAGAAIGAAIGGVAGAVWADRDGDGRADGYVREGQYYPGVPEGYDPNYRTAAASAPACRSVAGTAATGAGLGAAGGLGVTALTGGSLLAGAVVGAAVGGLAGAVWADHNNDGCVDGYVREGRYYEGAPVIQPTSNYRRSGERG